MSQYCLGAKQGINYCTPEGILGFRGVNSSRDLARLVPLSGGENKKDQLFLMFGVDVPTDSLPYLPDMGENSEFVNKGHWHWYQIEKAAFIWHFSIKNPGAYHGEPIVQAVLFKGNSTPTIFVNRIKELTQNNTLSEKDMKQINSILKNQQLDI